MLRRTSTLQLATVLLSSVIATGCISGRRPIVLDSTPAGAVVFIDGESSGHSTPCTLQLPNKRRTIEFRLDGFDSVSREMRNGSRSRVVYWSDAVTDLRTWPFPLWLSSADFFFPIKEDDGEMPARIHVRMSRTREPLALAR